mmetsp:Transcript_42162/g.59210  ORF Transcript_42162/g.59210 Transcript_42162/m.59210 type:complete len:128 (+) Transcript_42162:183-566(+)|eukprot:CAMPEP_0202451616 /NCGR_PEP_ID=MMETSP1360-20130828/10013_1 /ASSEMBLY_ACC=CAM_ASM_000848 /TAXON_ID=515479 /ORGANISM="Licmophora paradoxa, Strain CCMP2313" /LENGTH=127 /DNA_ID=CAMNT_0049070229 /DNA_START=154 /DNA_END=537 /DNA_ORIENTATION=-
MIHHVISFFLHVFIIIAILSRQVNAIFGNLVPAYYTSNYIHRIHDDNLQEREDELKFRKVAFVGHEKVSIMYDPAPHRTHHHHDQQRPQQQQDTVFVDTKIYDPNGVPIGKIQMDVEQLYVLENSNL